MNETEIKNCPPELEELARQIGYFIEYWGFKNVHGRMWCHLFLSNKPLDAAALMERLDISKTLVSFSIRELMEYEVIQEAEKSENGTQTYVANPNITGVILNVLRKREQRLLSHIGAAFGSLKKISSTEQAYIDSNRLDFLGDMIATATTTLDAFMKLKNVNFSLLAKFANANFRKG